MNERGTTLKPLYQAVLLLCALFLASCGGRASEEGGLEVSDPKLDAIYQKILVLPVEVADEFVKDYPYASGDCRTGLIAGLEMSKRFRVKLIDELPSQKERDTLIVRLKIDDMRIASKVARSLAGAFAGSSYLNVKMTLTDGHTRQVIREKDFSTHNNAFAAAWTMGSNDDSIPKDMGKIIGDYITAVAPRPGF
ncbi:MAG: DUF4410 domain-containing protein [Desulfobulbaceae bacterium]|jgi:hypothetical protein|nr:DUF4410 domain-containing protein [Desulfobulbaceae bacterium]